MNRKDLYNSFSEVDEDILERSENDMQGKKKPARLKWIALAACLCLAAAVTLPRFFPADIREAPHTPSTDTGRLPEDSFPPDPGTDELPDKTPEGPAADTYGNTSDTYADLPELLAYLSSHDIHDGEGTDALGEGNASPVRGESAPSESVCLTENTGVAVNMTGEYAYHIGESSVYISRLDGEDTENAGSIDVAADAVFICNDNLLILSRYQSGGDELDAETSVRLDIYDITIPREPVLLDEYTQLGELTACWMSGADLYLVTSDGVCACGWSRLDDPSEYYPALRHDGKEIEWNDDDISILGEPTSIRYSAVTVINGNSREVVSRQALYGNIKNLFYGADWIAAAVAGETAAFRENPVIYTFGRDLSFTGRIHTGRIAGVPEKNALIDYVPQDGSYLDIVSVTKREGIYRMLGTCSVLEGKESSSYFAAIAADTDTGEADCRLLPAEDYPNGSFTEIIWEENRAVACVGTMKINADADILQETRFLFAEFDGLDISFHENGLTADYLNNRVGVAYGNPFGKFRTLISMGDGIYVRYSHPGIGPGGFDVFDFSDSSAPLCLYRSETSLSGEDAFDYVWHVCGKDTFGTLKVLLGTEDFFRDVKLSWCVYQINMADKTTVTLQEEYFLDEEVKTWFGADAFGFAVFTAKDDVYYVTGKNSSAALLLQ